MTTVNCDTRYRYEFNDSDLNCACDTIDTWVDDCGQGRDNIAPEKLPWNAIRTLISQTVYGGRIDNEFDQRLLNTYLERMFTVSRLAVVVVFKLIYKCFSV